MKHYVVTLASGREVHVTASSLGRAIEEVEITEGLSDPVTDVREVEA